MGVDFLTCGKCKEVFPDAARYSYCNKCCNYLCEDCMSDDNDCLFCSGNLVTPEMKLKEIAELLKMFECPDFRRIINPIRRILEK